MVDNESIVNVVPHRILLSVGLTVTHLKITSVVIQCFNQRNNIYPYTKYNDYISESYIDDPLILDTKY